MADDGLDFIRRNKIRTSGNVQVASMSELLDNTAREFAKDIAPQQTNSNVIEQEIRDMNREPPPTPYVDRITDSFKSQLETTASQCLDRAVVLEMLAAQLRNRAAILNHQAVQIPEDFRAGALHEIECRKLAESLALIKYEE